MSSITMAHFVPIRLQTWPPQAILVSDWLIDVIWSICSFGKGKFILIFDRSVFLKETPQRFDNNIIILTH